MAMSLGGGRHLHVELASLTDSHADTSQALCWAIRNTCVSAGAGVVICLRCGAARH